VTSPSTLQDAIGNQTSSSGLITNTAADLLATAMRSPQLVTGNPADSAKLAGSPTDPGLGPGVPNPYGRGLSAYEPNTEVYVHNTATGGDAAAQAATGGGAIGQAAGGTAVQDAATPASGSGVAQSMTAEQNAKDAATAAALKGVNYAQGGLVDATGKVQGLIKAALDLANRHVPYVWGGTSANGVDCSGLIYYAAHAAGITDWKRYVAQQYGHMGTTVSAQDARPGDIVYYDEGGGAGHVGIYLGNGMMVAAPQSGQNVQVQKVYGTPTSYQRIFTDGMFGTAATATGSTYNYAGKPYTGYVNQRLAAGTPYASLFVTAGSKYGIPAALLAAVARHESGFNPSARSSAGAVGMMQFMPGTAASLGVNPLDPASSVDGAARYLAGLYNQFGSWDLALAAYNAGPGSVRNAGGVPSYAQGYVSAVQNLFQTYSG
jgi:cell wall-associated NlpC family hydrolase